MAVFLPSSRLLTTVAQEMKLPVFLLIPTRLELSDWIQPSYGELCG